MTCQGIHYDNVVDLLIQKVPELQPLLNEHLEDQFGQLLQHVFFGDLTRYVMKQMHLLQPQPSRDLPGAVRRILDFLEIVLKSSDMRARELVEASFLENLDQTGPAYAQLKLALNPSLRLALERTEN